MKTYKKLAGVVTRTGKAFGMGFGLVFTKPDALEVAAIAGLYQGLKYNGSLKRGIKAGVVVATVYGCINGIVNVAGNKEYIMQDWNKKRE